MPWVYQGLLGMTRDDLGCLGMTRMTSDDLG